MSKIKFGLVPPMPGADCDGLIDFSIKADKLNFDSLWFPDHLAFIAPSPAFEAWTIAAAVAKLTKNIDQTKNSSTSIIICKIQILPSSISS